MVHKIKRGKEYYEQSTYENDLKNLDLILKEAKISDSLKNAVIELKNALKAKNYDLAYELSSVKSLITGSMKPIEGYAFRENSNFNEKKIGESIYGYLDALHHKISFNMMRKGKEVVPSGVMILSQAGIREKPLPAPSKSPTLQRIKYEMEQIRKEVG